jgi:hypothetical protein
MKRAPQAIVSRLKVDLRVFSILYSPYLIWLDLVDWFFMARFRLGSSTRPGGVGAGPGFMRFPAWPPGLVPAVEAGEDRMRLFDGHLPDGAFFTAVDLLDEKCAHCNVSEIGIELDCGFHFEFSFLVVF